MLERFAFAGNPDDVVRQAETAINGRRRRGPRPSETTNPERSVRSRSFPAPAAGRNACSDIRGGRGVLQKPHTLVLIGWGARSTTSPPLRVAVIILAGDPAARRRQVRVPPPIGGRPGGRAAQCRVGSTRVAIP
jgi:hypothetical protein